MQRILAVGAGLAFFAACGGTKHAETSGTTSGPATTGGSTTATTTGGTTTGGGTTGAGTTTGAAQGTPCTANAQCASDICGTDGTGNCCSVACNTVNPICGALGCDQTGTCLYPAVDAGAILCDGGCSKALLTTLFCDTGGDCTINTGVAEPCAGNLACNPSGHACNTTCTTLADCAQGYTCISGTCIAQIAVGPCTTNDICLSLACGVDAGPGDCCKTACQPTATVACNATACDAQTGACVYPNGAVCGGPLCVNSQVSDGGICDDTGNCVTKPITCANHLGCNAAGTACNTSCTKVTDCAKDYYCDNAAGGCIPQTVFGPCTANDQCTSEFCGLNGTGNCCNMDCTSTAAICAAAGCDPANGACYYPDASVPCGTTLESCSQGLQQDPSVCDSMGNCPAPGLTACTPFLCGPTACLTTCTDATSCVAGAFCDTADSSCCPGGVLITGGTINVDAANGNDSTACCGIGNVSACRTIGHAMKLIDNAQVSNVTINVSVGGGGGNWTPNGETYPIVLGWGVELAAGGIYFYDPNGNHAEIFDIAKYSGNDTLGTASIVGTSMSEVWIGMNAGDTSQTADSSAIQVEAGSTLYLAYVSANGSATQKSAAITVIGGGNLTVGQDATAAITGGVQIGNSNDTYATDGWTGLACTSVGGKGCTVTDATLAGTKSLVIEGQENLDIDAEDYAKITLTSSPAIGVPPSAVGFKNCLYKPDAVTSRGEAVLLNGDVTMTFSNGTVQCISGDGFLLQSTPNGSPTLTMNKTTIQNTEWALVAIAGTATLSNSSIQYNYNGIEQAGTATVDLSGGAAGGNNTVACANAVESVNEVNLVNLTPGVCVLNATGADLDAKNVEWDTSGPDEFSCNVALTACSCEIPSCTTSPGGNGMDAVYTSSGTVTTTGAGQSTLSCSYSCGGGFEGPVTCKPGQFCCSSPDEFESCCENTESECGGCD